MSPLSEAKSHRIFTTNRPFVHPCSGLLLLGQLSAFPAALSVKIPVSACNEHMIDRNQSRRKARADLGDLERQS
jgi:hypothetical protein